MAPPRRPNFSSRRRKSSRAPWAVALIVALLAGIGAYLLVGRDRYWWPWPPACPAGGPLTIALGARANMPSPVLPDQLSNLVETAVDKEQPISVWRVDGDPSRAITETFHPAVSAPEPRHNEVVAATNDLLTKMGSIRSQVDEADPLAALRLAARDTPAGGTVILFDSGLSTAGPLNFLREGMLDADPQEVVTQLQSQEHAVPTCRGATSC
jgi:OmpA-OmpF porin, OOP family